MAPELACLASRDTAAKPPNSDHRGRFGGWLKQPSLKKIPYSCVYMLFAQNRLAKKNDIERVFKTGRSVYSGDLGLRFCPNQLNQSRFTVVISLKVHKKAVKRNLLKRRLREIIRREILPNARQGFDGVILTKKPLLDLEFSELKKLAIELFKKARLL